MGGKTWLDVYPAPLIVKRSDHTGSDPAGQQNNSNSILQDRMIQTVFDTGQRRLRVTIDSPKYHNNTTHLPAYISQSHLPNSSLLHLTFSHPAHTQISLLIYNVFNQLPHGIPAFPLPRPRC